MLDGNAGTLALVDIVCPTIDQECLVHPQAALMLVCAIHDDVMPRCYSYIGGGRRGLGVNYSPSSSTDKVG